jgi:hypothetical protein
MSLVKAGAVGTIRKRINEFLNLSVRWALWVAFGRGDIHVLPLINCDFSPTRSTFFFRYVYNYLYEIATEISRAISRLVKIRSVKTLLFYLYFGSIFYHYICGCIFRMLLFNFVNYVILLLCMFCSVYSLSLCCSVYCLCANVHCTTVTGCQPSCS